jgi:hypothetical protein
VQSPEDAIECERGQIEWNPGIRLEVDKAWVWPGKDSLLDENMVSLQF